MLLQNVQRILPLQCGEQVKYGPSFGNRINRISPPFLRLEAKHVSAVRMNGTDLAWMQSSTPVSHVCLAPELVLIYVSYSPDVTNQNLWPTYYLAKSNNLEL